MPYVVTKINGKRVSFGQTLFFDADVDRWRGGNDRYEIVNTTTHRRQVVGGKPAPKRRAQRATGTTSSGNWSAFHEKLSPTAYELEIFTENDGDLYRQMLQPIQKNLANKMANGTYDATRGADAFKYLIDAAAKKYAKEAHNPSSWNQMFSVADRKQVARRFAAEFEQEYALGNYNPYLTAAAKKRAIAAGRLPVRSRT